MIWPFAFALVFAAVSWSVVSDSYYHYTLASKVVNLVFWTALGAVIGVVFALFLGDVAGDFDRETKRVQPIVALADATHVEGRFYLFGGSVDSNPVYRYYYRSDGGFRMGWKPVDASLIVEETDTKPRWEKTSTHSDGTWWRLKSTRDSGTYTFYVPPGTVTHNFELDLEG